MNNSIHAIIIFVGLLLVPYEEAVICQREQLELMCTTKLMQPFSDGYCHCRLTMEDCKCILGTFPLRMSLNKHLLGL